MTKLAPPIARIVRGGIAARLREIEGDIEGTRARYARDPFALADDGHVTIFDLETNDEITLELWEHQREVISAWVDLEAAEAGRPRFRNVHEEKSRQMGLTWVTAYVALWALNFHELQGLALSQKLGEVCDSGPTTDSFFGRIKFMFDRLPEKLQAPLVFTGGNDPSIRNRTYTNSYLAGEGATPDAGRGGHYDYIFLDEAARIPWGRVVQTAVTRACPQGRFYNSTPKGEDPLYFWLRDKRPAGYTFLRHHWSRNPYYARGLHVAALAPDPETKEPGGYASQPDDQLAISHECEQCANTIQGVTWDASDTLSHRFPGRLTSSWYEDAIVDMTVEDVAQELDIDYAGSLPARVYTEFSEERNVVPFIPYDPDLPVELSFDFGWVMNAVGIFQETPTEYRMIGEFEAPDLIPEQVAAGLRGVLSSIGVSDRELSYNQSLQWLARGDPAAEATQMQTGRPLTADYRRLGFNITSRPFSVDYTIVAVKRLLMGRPKRLLLSAATCPATIRHFKMNKWETDRLGQRKPQAKLQNDEHNHMLRGLAYLITYKFPPPEAPGSQEGWISSEREERMSRQAAREEGRLTWNDQF